MVTEVIGGGVNLNDAVKLAGAKTHTIEPKIRLYLAYNVSYDSLNNFYFFPIGAIVFLSFFELIFDDISITVSRVGFSGSADRVALFSVSCAFCGLHSVHYIV